ncbi:MAG: glycogen synthase GlgA [Methylococcaceae bacterium]|nr:glycogen synthase GlgA [Methylococcaceae bacterium]
MRKILFVASEVYPLIKTGGLADVSGSLPIALHALGQDIRILMPAYADVSEALGPLPSRRIHQINGAIDIFETVLPGSAVPVWLIGHEGTFDRPGNPYLAPNGKPWPDNDVRFALLCRVGVEIAMNRVGLRWSPDIVHCNDWQTGLIPALLEDEPTRPATVFTIHNLAYQGLFPSDSFRKLALPHRFWNYESLEFYEQLSFIKGGLVYADRISTVSPNYATEIQGEAFGCGMANLLKKRSDRLSGIINGIDDEAWNPAIDPLIPAKFDAANLAGKAVDKAALQQQLGLRQDEEVALIALVGRTVQQKGIDLVLDIMPKLMEMPVQLAILGSGEKKYEQTLKQWSQLYPDRIALTVGYDEPLAHLIEAGADIFLMPSRFEPCGLNQMYSQRYGTPPVVHGVGGLADTVEDANPQNLSMGLGSGVVFHEASASELLRAVKRALVLFEDPELWKKIQQVAMSKDFSWRQSAIKYLDVYELALNDRHGGLARSRMASLS